MILNIFRLLFNLLSKSDKKRFLRIQGLMIFSSIIEVFSLALIPIYIEVVQDISVLTSSRFYVLISEFELGEMDLLNLFALVLIFFLVTSTILSYATLKAVSYFAAEFGTKNGDKLYSIYLNQNWLFHTKSNSSSLINNISSEAIRATDLVIFPLLMMNSKLVLTVIVFTGLIIYNPFITTVALFLFSISYFIFFYKVRGLLTNNGRELSRLYENRFKLMNEGFGGLKDLIVTGKLKYYSEKFNDSGKLVAAARAQNHILWQAPKYFVELLVFGLLILFIFVTNNISSSNTTNDILNILSIYALAAFKLLPSIQQIYASIGQIRGNISSFENIIEGLELQRTLKDEENNSKTINEEFLDSFKKNGLQLSDVSFKYPGTENYSLKNINIHIKPYTQIGIIGPSGSGKSSLLNLLLGLINPTSGSLLIGNKVLTKENYHNLRTHIGFVPQEVFLIDESLEENIAFGTPPNEIDHELLSMACKKANLDDLISNLSEGIKAKVGERGSLLSGGQRQRISIARALYNKPSILILDEATSALDNETEKHIINSLDELKEDVVTTIIVTHSLAAVKNSDLIFIIENGQVTDFGTPLELRERHDNWIDFTDA